MSFCQATVETGKSMIVAGNEETRRYTLGDVVKLNPVFDSYLDIYYSIHNIVVSAIIQLNTCFNYFCI